MLLLLGRNAQTILMVQVTVLTMQKSKTISERWNLWPLLPFNSWIVRCVAAPIMKSTKNVMVMGTSSLVVGIPPNIAACGVKGPRTLSFVVGTITGGWELAPAAVALGRVGWLEDTAGIAVEEGNTVTVVGDSLTDGDAVIVIRTGDWDTDAVTVRIEGVGTGSADTIIDEISEDVGVACPVTSRVDRDEEVLLWNAGKESVGSNTIVVLVFDIPNPIFTLLWCIADKRKRNRKKRGLKSQKWCLVKEIKLLKGVRQGLQDGQTPWWGRVPHPRFPRKELRNKREIKRLLYDTLSWVFATK